MNGEIDPNIVTPGVAGSLMVLGLAIATYFIVRGLLKHMRRIQKAADEQNDQE